ncbi:COG3650 family protein [Tsuneonella sp. HG249]
MAIAFGTIELVAFATLEADAAFLETGTADCRERPNDMNISILAAAAALLFGLAACGSEQAVESDPAQAGSSAPSEQGASPGPQKLEEEEAGYETAFAGIAPDETVKFVGTEPFWGGQVKGTALTYSHPDNPDGTDFAVSRFAGRGGVSWTGIYEGARFVLAVTPGECSDGMSDRTYPFVATLEVTGEQRSGCAWTERNSFSGPANP